MLKRIFPVSLLLIALLPAVSPAEAPSATVPTSGVISFPIANVHEEPELKAPIATQVLLGDEVRILKKQDYWFRISLPGQGAREGWIQQEAVQVLRDKGRALHSDRKLIVITVPKTPALILDRLGDHNTSLYGGTRLPVLAQDADGYRVQFPDRTVAVIPLSDAAAVKPFSPLFSDIAPADIAKTARKFLGVRYLAGGITAQGMDSRGLIHVVYRIHGVDLDAGYDSLKAHAVKVPKKEMQPGDILVFSGEGMGLLLTNGQFLRGDRRAGIQLGGIHDRRYANSLLYGLRILGEDPEQKKHPAEMTADEIMIAQTQLMGAPLGRRIVSWAARFIGTPYDTDPLGLYVRTNRIVADEKADCMYLTFRAVELARSTTPGEAVEQALELRFRTKGVLADGLVTNYGDRFEYGEDMVSSGKWGRNITDELGRTASIPGSRGRDAVIILPKDVLATKKLQKQLQDGDIIYWVKDPKKRSAAMEIVAHLSFVRLKDGKVFLIHAGGTKDSDARPGKGQVREVPLADYLRETRFIGAFVTRLEP